MNLLMYSQTLNSQTPLFPKQAGRKSSFPDLQVTIIGDTSGYLDSLYNSGHFDTKSIQIGPEMTILHLFNILELIIPMVNSLLIIEPR